VRRLLVDGGDDRARLVVEAVLGPRVAHALDGVAHDGGQVRVGLGRDLARDEGQPGGHHRLAGHPAVRVLGDQRVQDRVGDLVRDLVGVALGHRLRGEEVAAVLTHPVGPPELASAYSGLVGIVPKPDSLTPARREGQSSMTQARGWNWSYTLRR